MCPEFAYKYVTGTTDCYHGIKNDVFNDCCCNINSCGFKALKNC